MVETEKRCTESGVVFEVRYTKYSVRRMMYNIINNLKIHTFVHRTMYI